MRPINILSVCGSGTVSSAMLTSKLTDILEENGYEVEATEVAPGGVELAVQTANYDLIAYTSPVEDSFGFRSSTASEMQKLLQILRLD